MDRPSVIAVEGDLWVLNKPSGVAVHPAGPDGPPDLMTLAVKELGAPSGLAPAHRLDLETSGIVLCSPSGALRAQLGQWFKDGQVNKEYLALVHGRTRLKGIIRRPLQDGRRGRPLEAVTRYKCLSWLGRMTLIKARPETGRQHQIRRHLQGIGHAIVGDARYPPKRPLKVPGFPDRLWLHSAALTLPDGRAFAAPLPPELLAHLALLEALFASDAPDRGEGATTLDAPDEPC